MQLQCTLTLKHSFLVHVLHTFSRGLSKACSSKSPQNLCKGPIYDKCVLINGGTDGIGLECARALLSKGCKGITLTGTNEKEGENALKCICEQFGNNRAVFLKCDFTKQESIDWAFKNTIRVYDRLDIVINNTGIMNDKKWEHQIINNINGYITANLLSLQYMSCTCMGSGGSVINIFSTMSVNPIHGCPIYNTTQSAILGLTRSLGGGCTSDRTGVKIMGLCVGLSDECILQQGVDNAINDKFAEELKDELDGKSLQDPSVVGHGLVKVLEKGYSGSVWSVDEGNPACEVKFPSLQEILNCCK